MVAKLIQVIQTELRTRGTGKDESSPIRGITEYWSLDGKLLAEVDPCPPNERDRAANIVNKWRTKRLDAGMTVPAMLMEIEAEIRSYRFG